MHEMLFINLALGQMDHRTASQGRVVLDSWLKMLGLNVTMGIRRLHVNAKIKIIERVPPRIGVVCADGSLDFQIDAVLMFVITDLGSCLVVKCALEPTDVRASRRVLHGFDFLRMKIARMMREKDGKPLDGTDLIALAQMMCDWSVFEFAVHLDLEDLELWGGNGGVPYYRVNRPWVRVAEGRVVSAVAEMEGMLEDSVGLRDGRDERRAENTDGAKLARYRDRK